MKISLIIPTYNREKLLSKTISSVLNQTVKIDEIIIIDDGSTDNTKEIVNNFQNNTIKYIYQENKGVSNARNHGIKIASYEWLSFLDSDDIWEEEKIEKQIKFHKQNPHIFLSHTDELWMFNNKIIKQKKHQLKPSGFCFEENIPNTLIGASTLIVHKKVFEDVGYFDEDLIACEDYDLWLRILRKYELGLVDEKLITKIAGHENQLSFSTKLMDRYRISALQKHLDSQYKESISNEIIKKCDILIKGAIKHNNQEIKEEYLKLKMLSTN
ncbi:glycosyltransferase family A protein [Arcobacteraceae bacterium]|nr:glycosyltransferase family A protein [Arcobacteraceae bacterium]